jgi:hypothetical protein
VKLPHDHGASHSSTVAAFLTFRPKASWNERLSLAHPAFFARGKRHSGPAVIPGIGPRQGTPPVFPVVHTRGRYLRERQRAVTMTRENWTLSAASVCNGV